MSGGQRRICIGGIVGLAALCLAALSFSAQARVQPYGSAPLLSLKDSRVGAWVTVNERGPFKVLIDTAASHSIMTPNVLARIPIDQRGIRPVNAVVAGGRIQTLLYPVREVATAGVIVEGIEVMSIDLPKSLGVDGVLAADFLSACIVELDIPRGRLILYPEGSGPDQIGRFTIHGRLNRHGFLIFKGDVDGVAADIFLDTGASSTVANIALSRNLRTQPTRLMEVETYIHGADGRREIAKTQDTTRIGVGPIVWRHQTILASDLAIFGALQLSEAPALLIGMDLLKGHRIILNYEQGTASIVPWDN